MNTEKYRELLINNGFSEAQKHPYHFFKELMPYTALGINLKDEDCGISIVYGCGSTAFTKFAGEENRLIEYGFFDNCDMNIRHKLIVVNSEDEFAAGKEIKDFHARFCNIEKDELLKIAKERRKLFINSISAKVKPLGFKKKGNLWKYSFQNDLTLCFYLYSRFSDEYRCDLYILKEGMVPQCWQETIPWNTNTLFFDWQLIDEKSMDDFIDNQVIKCLNEIISIGIEAFGNDPNARENRFCHHNKCDVCWLK